MAVIVVDSWRSVLTGADVVETVVVVVVLLVKSTVVHASSVDSASITMASSLSSFLKIPPVLGRYGLPVTKLGLVTKLTGIDWSFVVVDRSIVAFFNQDICTPVLSRSSVFSGWKVGPEKVTSSSLASVLPSAIVWEWISWSKGKDGLTRLSGLQNCPSRRIGAVHWQRPNKSGIRKSQWVFGSQSRQWACS